MKIRGFLPIHDADKFEPIRFEVRKTRKLKRDTEQRRTSKWYDGGQLMPNTTYVRFKGGKTFLYSVESVHPGDE